MKLGIEHADIWVYAWSLLCLYVSVCIWDEDWGKKQEKHVCIPNLLCLSTVSYVILNSLFSFFSSMYSFSELWFNCSITKINVSCKLCFSVFCATYELLLFIFYALVHAMLFWIPQTIIKHQQGLMETGRGYSRELLFPFYLAACSRQKQAVAQQLRHLSRSGFTADKLLLKWMAAIVLTSREDFSLTCYRFKAFSCHAMRLKMYDLLCWIGLMFSCSSEYLSSEHVHYLF